MFLRFVVVQHDNGSWALPRSTNLILPTTGRQRVAIIELQDGWECDCIASAEEVESMGGAPDIYDGKPLLVAMNRGVRS